MGFNEYNSIFDAAKKIYLYEGLGGFMTGLKVSLVRDVPFSGTFYPIYNWFKTNLLNLYLKKNGDFESSTHRLRTLAIISGIASFSANIVSCTLTHPLDLIRTRIFFQHHNKDQSQQYSSISQAIKKIY